MAAIHSRRQQHANTLVVDSGNIAGDESKGRMVWAAMVKAGYDAVGFGPAEAGWETAYWSLVAQQPLPVVALPGLVPAASSGTSPRAAIVKRIAGRTIGITTSGPRATLTADETERLLACLRSLRATCDLVILLTHRALAEERQALVGPLSGLVDLAIGARGSDSLAAPEQVGGAYLLPAAIQGYRVGCVEIRWREPAPGVPRVDIGFGAIELSHATPEDPGVARNVAQYYAEEQDRFLTQGLAEDVGVLVKQGYVAPERCGECHGAAEGVWKGSAHARAVSTLTQRHSAVPECLACHSEAFRAAGKLLSGEHPQGVECASCHANGAMHLTAPKRGTIGRGSLEACATCHKGEHSPGFDEAAAWEKLRH